MKKLYLTILMLAMMVAALNFAACGGDDKESSKNPTRLSSKTIAPASGPSPLMPLNLRRTERRQYYRPTASPLTSILVPAA